MYGVIRSYSPTPSDLTHSARLHFLKVPHLSRTVGGAGDQELKSLSLWGHVGELIQSGKEEWKSEMSRREETMGKGWGRRGFILVICLVAVPKYPDEAA